MAFSINNKAAYSLSDSGAISWTISSAHNTPFPIAHAATNILSD